MPTFPSSFELPALLTAAFLAGAGAVYWYIKRERKALVFEVRSLWERLDSVFYRSPVAISLCELDQESCGLRVLDCNEEACVLHGGSRDEVLAAGVRMPAQSIENAQKIRAWFKTPRPADLWRGETMVKRLNGTEVPVAYVWTRVEIGDRELVLAVEQDISEQRQADLALKESELRFRQLVETADCLLWKARVRMVEGQLVWKFDVPVSGLRQRLFAAANVAASEGGLWGGFDVPDMATMHERCRLALQEGEKSYRQEFSVLLPHETMWMQERVEIEKLGADEWSLVGVVVDITRLKESEAAMRRSEERNRLVMKASNDGIWDFDVVANRMATSERCRTMLGLRSDEVATAEDWRTRINPDDLTIQEVAWNKHRATGEPCVYQARFRHEDGSWRWLMVRAITVTNDAGELLRIVGSHTDITELKRNDSELQQGRRLSAIGELVGGIAHEFNNLLTPMLLQTTMMTDDSASPPHVKEQLRPVIDTIKDARELTQRILTFGRRSTVDAESLDLVAAVQDHLELLRHTIDRRVVLNLVTPTRPMWVLQNRTDFAQIIINLVLNARDTLLEKAERITEASWTPTLAVRFTTVNSPTQRGTSSGLIDESSGLWHRVTVRDNGMGMKDEIRERIFEPFYTTKQVGQGSGLGLATVWHLVQTMGGRVDVETRVGVGSAFHVSLPAVDAPRTLATPPAATASAVVALRNRFARVLLVDDQPEVAETLGRILERWGHNVTIVRDGSAAVRRLERGQDEFDVCITDLNMPGATGFDVVGMIRERNSSTKVVVMGGYMTPEVRQSLEQMKVDAIVPKPFSVQDIETAMRVSGW
ncbi:MAG: PAS domain S-box protein [Opitutus sp.]